MNKYAALGLGEGWTARRLLDGSLVAPEGQIVRA